MELRHLRYFVGVVEAGSLTEAAAEKLPYFAAFLVPTDSRLGI
jgi:hypothetical protein